jgi:hypothetical protein
VRAKVSLYLLDCQFTIYGGLDWEVNTRVRWREELPQLLTAFGTNQTNELQSNQYNPGDITREERQLIVNWQRQAWRAESLQLLQLPAKEIPLSKRTALSPRTGTIRFIGLIAVQRSKQFQCALPTPPTRTSSRRAAVVPTRVSRRARRSAANPPSAPEPACVASSRGSPAAPRRSP